MKNVTKKGLVMILAVALVLPVLVKAEESMLKTKPILNTGRVDSVERANKLEEVKAKLEEAKNMNQEKRQDRLSNHLKLVTERIDRALTRITNLLAKIDKYLAQLESRGVDVSRARVAKTEAETALETARKALADLPNQFGTPANPEKLTVAEAQKIRQAIQNVADLVKTANEKVQDLVKIVRDLRPTPSITPVTINPGTGPTPTPDNDTVPERIN